MPWGSCGKTLRDKLQRLQNRAARVRTNSNYDEGASILLNDLGWQDLESRLLILEAVMVYKSFNCPAPDYMSSKFILRSDLFNSYNLRDSENKLAVPLPRTNYYRNSFCYSEAVLWNNLVSDVRQAKSLTSFLKLLHGIHGKQALILQINYFYLFNSTFVFVSAITVN